MMVEREVTEVTFGSDDLCGACGHQNAPRQPGELMRIDCDSCGASALTFGRPRTYTAQLRVEVVE